MKNHECEINCNRERIHDFLSGDTDRPGPLLAEQLGECAACRAYFDSHVASVEEWSRMGQLLQPGDYDLATRIDFSAGSDAGRQARQSVSINDVLESLAPTDDPHSLGRIGKYEVNGVIGAGGMGVVLKAFEPSLDRVVAIKVLAPHLANNDTARQRFEREARAAAAVINPNVIPIYSVTSDGKLPYLAMACIQGGSLQQRLDAEGAASVPEVLRIGSQIASGLAAAHEQGLVHRDIKPENILFEGDVERVSITDFGLARAVDDNTVTQAGTIAGTPMYMSPEQARGEQVDQQSDLFSLGSVLYAMCTGQPPYCADSSLGVMRKITDESPTPILELNPEIPDWLARVVEKLMARDKADRYASAAEVHEVLEACLSHVQQPTTSPLPDSLKKESGSGDKGVSAKLRIGGMAVFLIVCGLLAAFMLPGEDSKQPGSAPNARIFKPLAAIDGYIYAMLIDTKDPDSTFLGVGQIGESENSLTLRPFNDAIRITYHVSDNAMFPNSQGKFVERIRQVAEKMSVQITERSEMDHNGNVEGLVLSLTFEGERRELTTSIRQLVAQVFGVELTTECKFTFCNLPGQSGEDRSKKVSRKEFLEALDSGYVYAGEILNTIYIGPPELTAQDYVPWTDSIYWIRVNELQEDELGITRLGKVQFAALNKSDENVSVVAGDDVSATLAGLSDSDLALIYEQLTGAELGKEFIPGPILASSIQTLLGKNFEKREDIAKKLVDLGKPDLAKIVLSGGRVDPAAAEALKLGDLLMETGDGDKAIDAWLTAYRIDPRLFAWQRIDAFDKHKRLKDLAEVFTKERIRDTRTESVTPLHFLLKRLMADDLRASVGMPFMDRLWKARPNIRAWIIDETKWDEVPNRADYFAELLIPADVEKVGDGWRRMYDESGVAGGWLYDMRKMIDEEAAPQLLAKIKPVLEAHPKWIAGSATEVTLEAMAGNFDPAKQWIENNFDTGQGSKPRVSLGRKAKYLGATLEGRDRGLDEQIIKLYEHAVQHRHAKLPYRDSGVHGLARLYCKCGRQQEAIDLMVGLVDRERKAEEYLTENWGRAETVNLEHERIWDLRTAVGTLNGIGYPMDSLALLSRVDFEQRRQAGKYKGGGWEYDDKQIVNATRGANQRVTVNAIVEALNRGVIPIGLASTLNKESGELENPTVELLKQVTRDELSEDARAAFSSVNPKLANAGAMDEHLARLMKQHPADVDIAVAATIFSFLQDDVETAKGRLEVVDSLTATNHKARAADVNLYLVAEHASKHEETAEIGKGLAKRVAESGREMTNEWKQFFASKVAATAENVPSTKSIGFHLLEQDNPIRGVTRDDGLQLNESGKGPLSYVHIKPAFEITKAKIEKLTSSPLQKITLTPKAAAELSKAMKDAQASSKPWFVMMMNGKKLNGKWSTRAFVNRKEIVVMSNGVAEQFDLKPKPSSSVGNTER